MKMKNLSYVLVLLIGLFLISCKEEPPYINFEVSNIASETTYVQTGTLPLAPLRVVLLEDVSGVRCVNCPDAANIIENIKNANPGRMNSITIHPNTPSLQVFTRPLNNPDKNAVSKFDFRTTMGGDIVSNLGIPGSLPSGYINRKLFAGKNARFIDRTEWANFFAAEKDSVPPVDIKVEGKVEGNQVVAKVDLTFLQDLTGDYNLSLFLLEDSIVDVQEYQDGAQVKYDPVYVHKHVLRDMFTSSNGEKLNGSVIGGQTVVLVKGRVIEKTFSKELKADWRKEKIEILAAVHRGSDNVVVHCKKFDFK